MGKSVWADCFDVPGHVCKDARLKGSNLKYPNGTTAGQAGWDVGINFRSISDLATKLEKEFKRGEISRLAIHCHGLKGEFYPSGQNSPHMKISASGVLKFKSDLVRIGYQTSEQATILIVGCLAGQGQEGTNLLRSLSQHVWPKRKIVAFTTIGFAWGSAQKRTGQSCSDPGMRDTDELYGTLDNSLQNSTRKLWSDLIKLPWASEKSPHAKVVQGNKLLKTPPEPPSKPPRKKEPIWSFKDLWNLREEIKKLSEMRPQTVDIKRKLTLRLGEYMRKKEAIQNKKNIIITE